MPHIVIEGLRGVGRVELTFDDASRVFTLFGSNGVGKTKCLEALYQYWLSGHKAAGKIFANGGWAVAERISLNEDVVFNESRTLLGMEKLAQSNQGVEHDRPVVFVGAQGRSSLLSHSRYGDKSSLGVFAERQKRYFDAVVKSLNNGTLAQAEAGGDITNWFVARAQSVNPYQKEADNRKVELDTVLAMLHALDPRIDPEKLEIDGSGNVSLSIEGKWRKLSELSSGFASLLKLVQAIVAGYAAFSESTVLSSLDGIVFIDEIESHLHVSWQANIIPVLKKLLPNTTFYIATHSPLVLAQLHEHEAYLLKRSKRGVESSVIESPNKRAFVDVLESAMNVDLNALKREGLATDQQADAKQNLLDLLKSSGGGQ